MPTLVNRLLRTPWGFPAVVVLALAGIAGNEYSHRRTLAGLAESQSADEVTRHANTANYYALDRANSLRAHLLEPHERWVARYREADGKLTASIAHITAFLEQRSGSAGQAMSGRVADLLAVRSADLARAFGHAQSGQREQAIAALRESDAAGRGSALRTALLEAVALAQAGSVSADTRLLAAMEALRWLVHGLIVAMLLGAYVLLRQTQLIDAARRQQAARLGSEVAARTAQLRELAGHLITTREDERARLARELHDEMGSLLSAIKLDLARLRRNRELPASAAAVAEAMNRRVSEVVGLKRQVIENLRPSALDHLGLAEALSLLCRENAAAMERPTHEDVAPIGLAPALELTIYRIAQEALTNARKYSRASEIWVALKAQGEEVHLSVEDDGIGFDEAATGPGHHGVAGMRLRVESHGGRLEVGPRSDGRGTRILAVLPARGA
jgi:signal transduction histidine kinase